MKSARKGNMDQHLDQNKGFKINYITKNSLEWLGWESKDLISKDVAEIIPRTFKKLHRSYMN